MNINGRIILRNDSSNSWTANADKVPLKGEPCIEFTSNGTPLIRIGDGVKKFSELPIANESTNEVSIGENPPVDISLLWIDTYTNTIQVYDESQESWIQYGAKTQHTHNASNIVSGTISIARGGTGASTAAAALKNLGAAAADHTHENSGLGSDVIIPIEQGGTNATDAEGALANLGAAPVEHTHSAGEINSGILPIGRGGTGSGTAEAALLNLGAAAASHTHTLDVFDGVLPIEKGGTGGNTIEQAQTALNVSDKGHSHTLVSTEKEGYMSTADKVKLDSVEEGANKTVTDSALSDTSTNPVQNKIVKTALDNKAESTHTHADVYSKTDIDQKLSKEQLTATLNQGDAAINAATLGGKSASDFAPAVHTHPVATQEADGFMSKEDKIKLDSYDNTGETAQSLLSKIKTVDGPNSGLDADLLDGKQAIDFATAEHTHAAQEIPVVSDTQNGLMISTDKTKLDGIQAEANKTVVDGALSAESDNPVSNKIIKGALDKKADLDSSGKVLSSQLPAMDYIPTSQKGVANGVASLDATGKVPSSQLPEVESSGGYVAQTTAPTDTSVLWIDTTNGNIMKYYNGTAWTTLSAVWG